MEIEEDNYQKILAKLEKLEIENKKLKFYKQKYEELKSDQSKGINFFDIVESEKEKQFNEFNKKFSFLADNIPGYIAYVSADTLVYEFVNKAFQESFGVLREKIFGSHIKDIIGEANYQFALKYINSIYDASQSAYKLLDDLLQWAQSQTGNLEFLPEAFNLKNLILEVIELFKNLAKSKNINLVTVIPDELRIFADKNMIKTILRNLVINAIKFTNKGGTVKLSSDEQDDKTLITVTDNGVGMDEFTINNLFSENERATSAGTENEKGIGLGLILCKEFVEKNGGTIWAESAEGKGSSFYFTIPSSNAV